MKKFIPLIIMIALVVVAGTFTMTRDVQTPPDEAALAPEEGTPADVPEAEDEAASPADDVEGESGMTPYDDPELDEDAVRTMTITIPGEYMDGATQDELDQQAGEGKFMRAILNTDGSVSIDMTEEQYDQTLAATAQSLEEQVKGMIGSEEYPNIVSIEHNEDFTEYIVTTKSTQLDAAEALSPAVFYMYGGMYKSFAGEAVHSIHVVYVNEQTGETIQEADSADMDMDMDMES